MASSLEHQRHTLAHLLAAAVMELWPSTKRTIGPAIDSGFYFDFEFTEPISESDLPLIEKRMRDILPGWKTTERHDLSVEDARHEYVDNAYKQELIDEFSKNADTLSFYKSGNYWDLCRGGHVENPAEEIALDSFKLDRIAGAYWRGDEKNKMLTRIYGLAFATKTDLDAYILLQQEADKRDHRKLGAELDIFAFDDDVGPGLPLWLPNGATMIEELEILAKEMENKGGYKRVRSPHIAKEKLYVTSGHLPYYEESMYPPMEYENTKYYLKAMNCPHHHKIYAARPKSYRDLPLRLAEYGTCYRHEKSGELFGLMRVRSLQMNDAHIYCTEEQFFDEFKAVIQLYLIYFKIFGIEKYTMRLSKHAPEKLGQKYINEPELWKKTEDMVRKSLIDLQVPFVEAEDEAAFYGPKIDIEIWSAIGREFTLATNQVDFAVPGRFKLTYIDKNGKAQTPLCIHRAPLSTHERLIGFLIEHYAGNFPTWLSPVQVRVLPIGEAHTTYAQNVYEALINQNIRVELDTTNETLGKKIREAKRFKIPYLLIIGDAEIKEEKITLEGRSGKLGTFSITEVIDIIKKEISSRS